MSDVYNVVCVACVMYEYECAVVCVACIIMCTMCVCVCGVCYVWGVQVCVECSCVWTCVQFGTCADRPGPYLFDVSGKHPRAAGSVSRGSCWESQIPEEGKVRAVQVPTSGKGEKVSTFIREPSQQSPGGHPGAICRVLCVPPATVQASASTLPSAVAQ